MAKSTAKLFEGARKKLKHDIRHPGDAFDPKEAARYGEMNVRNVSDLGGLRGKASEEYNRATGKKAKEAAAREAERLAAIPEAKANQGQRDTKSLLGQRGRHSTMKTRRLGSRSLLG